MNKTTINIWYIVAALAGFMLIQSFYQTSKQNTTIPYSQFEQLLDENKVDKVWIEQNSIEGTLKEKQKDGLERFVTTRVSPDLAAKLDKHHVTYFRRSAEHVAYRPVVLGGFCHPQPVVFEFGGG
jgi:cell division protease FtsH